MKFARLLRSSRCFFSNSNSSNLKLTVLRNVHTSTSSYCQKENVKSEKNNAYTHFGFETVKDEEKSERVYEVFKNVAAKYDLMNDTMSLGIHRLWKDEFVRVLHPTPGIKSLDVAGGTGDIAFRIVKHIRCLSKNKPDLTNGTKIVLCDINQEMLNVGKSRAESLGYQNELEWLCADAEALPVEDGTFDTYTIAFGIRNVTHIDKVLNEAFRVLKPGGRFLCLEFSHLTNPILQWAYDTYSFQVIPPMGQILARDWKSYQYLVESIRKFPTQEEFSSLIRSAGFSSVTYTNLTCGITAIHSAFKI